jgi:hypothetical protein
VTEAWRRVLSFLQGRKRAYQLAFGSPAGEAVLLDLAKFCRAHETCFDPDPRIHAVLEGRREVWLRIQQHMNLSVNQLAALYKVPQASQED